MDKPLGFLVYRVEGVTNLPTGGRAEGGFLALEVDWEDDPDQEGSAWTNFYSTGGEILCSMERVKVSDIPEWKEWADSQSDMTREESRETEDPMTVRELICHLVENVQDLDRTLVLAGDELYEVSPDYLEVTEVFRGTLHRDDFRNLDNNPSEKYERIPVVIFPT